MTRVAEDALCNIPCGEEPFGCADCPNAGDYDRPESMSNSHWVTSVEPCPVCGGTTRSIESMELIRVQCMDCEYDEVFEIMGGLGYDEGYE